MHITTTRRYIYPPRATTAISKDKAIPFYTKLGWIGQAKVNDTRALFDFDISHSMSGTTATLVAVWNRHNAILQHDWSKLQANLERFAALYATINNTGPGLEQGRYLFDGGLLHYKHSAIKNTVAIWDIIVEADKHLIGSTYQTRYDKLRRCADDQPYCIAQDIGNLPIGYLLDQNIFMPQNLITNEWDNFWNGLVAVNNKYNQPVIEGIVFKDPRGKLKNAFKEQNNSDWLGRCRVATGRHQF